MDEQTNQQSLQDLIQQPPILQTPSAYPNPPVQTVNMPGKKSAPKLDEHITKRIFIEVLGTFSFTFFACPVNSPWVFGGIYICFLYTIGDISGCHLNPAVSLNMFMRKRLDLPEFISYICAQFGGALLGSFMQAACSRFTFSNLGSADIGPRLKKHTVEDGNDVYTFDFSSFLAGCIAEMLLTFFFVMIVNGVNDKRYDVGKFSGLVIGIAYIIMVMAGFGYTGGSLNPARSLAPALFEAFAGHGQAMKELFCYIIGPFAGAALAAVVYGRL